jgi:hypothetical protein
MCFFPVFQASIHEIQRCRSSVCYFRFVLSRRIAGTMQMSVVDWLALD